jgi:site-specific DNA-cytosine methylase
MKTLESIIDASITGDAIPLTEIQRNKIRINRGPGYNIVNINFINSRPYVVCSNGFSPTILTDKPHVIYELKRPFTIKELLQLQGFPKNFKIVVSKTQIIKQIGNSMSVCVVKKIIKEALKCI